MSYTIQKALTLINKGAKGLNKPQWIIEHFVGAAGQAWGNANYFKSVYHGAFGGLSYDILGNPAPHVYLIKTSVKGTVAIYAGPGTGATITGKGGSVANTTKKLYLPSSADTWRV